MIKYFTNYIINEDEDEQPYPTYISRIALYTANFILLDSIVALYTSNYNLSIILFILYCTTLLHWYEIKNGIIKQLDILCASLTIIFITYNSNYLLSYRYQQLWYYTITLCIIIFFINEIFFIICKKITLPNSIGREFIYYINTYIHIIFLHIIIPLLYLFYFILSKI
jgi:hypothetical protein